MWPLFPGNLPPPAASVNPGSEHPLAYNPTKINPLSNSNGRCLVSHLKRSECATIVSQCACIRYSFTITLRIHIYIQQVQIGASISCNTLYPTITVQAAFNKALLIRTSIPHYTAYCNPLVLSIATLYYIREANKQRAKDFVSFCFFGAGGGRAAWMARHVT